MRLLAVGRFPHDDAVGACPVAACQAQAWWQPLQEHNMASPKALDQARTQNQATSPGGSAPLDPVGPHGNDQAAPGGHVSGGGTEGTAPVNFDDDEIMSGRGKSIRTGGTADAKGGDSGRVGAPAEQRSDHIGPSDPDVGRQDER
jgi:hypothetical protein